MAANNQCRWNLQALPVYTCRLARWRWLWLARFNNFGQPLWLENTLAYDVVTWLFINRWHPWPINIKDAISFAKHCVTLHWICWGVWPMFLTRQRWWAGNSARIVSVQSRTKFHTVIVSLNTTAREYRRRFYFHCSWLATKPGFPGYVQTGKNGAPTGLASQSCGKAHALWITSFGVKYHQLLELDGVKERKQHAEQCPRFSSPSFWRFASWTSHTQTPEEKHLLEWPSDWRQSDGGSLDNVLCLLP